MLATTFARRALVMILTSALLAKKASALLNGRALASPNALSEALYSLRTVSKSANSATKVALNAQGPRTTAQDVTKTTYFINSHASTLVQLSSRGWILRPMFASLSVKNVGMGTLTTSMENVRLSMCCARMELN